MAFLALILSAVLTPLYAPQTAVRSGPVQVAPLPSAPAYDGRCAEWAGAALEAGWQPEQLPELLDVIMWCESKCQPGAHNPSGATGLLQIMPMWHKGRDAYDPNVNLAIGLEVYEAQGWQAWQCA